MAKPEYIVKCGTEFWSYGDVWITERAQASRMSQEDAELLAEEIDVEFDERGPRSGLLQAVEAEEV